MVVRCFNVAGQGSICRDVARDNGTYIKAKRVGFAAPARALVSRQTGDHVHRRFISILSGVAAHQPGDRMSAAEYLQGGIHPAFR
jgi:hypothetical protein